MILVKKVTKLKKKESNMVPKMIQKGIGLLSFLNPFKEVQNTFFVCLFIFVFVFLVCFMLFCFCLFVFFIFVLFLFGFVFVSCFFEQGKIGLMKFDEPKMILHCKTNTFRIMWNRLSPLLVALTPFFINRVYVAKY